MSRSKSEKNGNGSKCELSIWTRAITANSEWPDKVNITSLLTIHVLRVILILMHIRMYFDYLLLT